MRAALRANSIPVLDDASRELHFDGRRFDLLGIPDARIDRPVARTALQSLSPDHAGLVFAA